MVISGGQIIENYKKLNQAPKGLGKEAGKQVWVADLPKVLGKPVTTISALFDGECILPRAHSAEYRTTKEDLGDSLFGFNSGDVKSYANMKDAEIVIIPKQVWTVNCLSLEKIDEQKRVAQTALPSTYSLTSHGGWSGDIKVFYQVENVVEVLDKPGEWVVDTGVGKIYLWPRNSETPESSIIAPVVTELILFVGNLDQKRWVENITLQVLTFSHGDLCAGAPTAYLCNMTGSSMTNPMRRYGCGELNG